MRVMFVAVAVFVTMSRVFGMAVTAILRVAFRQVVMVKMKEPLEKEHREKAAQHPGHRPVQRTQLFSAVGKEMQQRNPEHQAGDEADRHLQPGVREADEQGQPAACQRGEEHERAVNGQQPTGGHHRPVLIYPVIQRQPESGGARTIVLKASRQGREVRKDWREDSFERTEPGLNHVPETSNPLLPLHPWREDRQGLFTFQKSENATVIRGVFGSNCLDRDQTAS